MLTNNEKNPETTTSNPTELDALVANLHIVREQTKELEHALENLEGKLQYARGTGDITEQANAAVKLVSKPVKRERQPKEAVLHVIEGASRNVAHIARETGLNTTKVSEIVKALKQERKIANVGSEDFPQWTARIGDVSSASDLNAEIKRLVSERPMTTQELIETTGARLSRVSGALVALQRGPNQVLNLGSSRRARWFLVSDKVTIAKLNNKGDKPNF